MFTTLTKLSVRAPARTGRSYHVRMSLSNTSSLLQDAVIVSAVRTPQGSFMGSLASVKASELGATAVKAALEHASKLLLVNSLMCLLFFQKLPLTK